MSEWRVVRAYLATARNREECDDARQYLVCKGGIDARVQEVARLHRLRRVLQIVVPPGDVERAMDVLNRMRGGR